MTERRRFTVSRTAYLRNLSREEICGGAVAIHYQEPPKTTEHGTSFGMRWPVLMVSLFLDDQQETAEKVARPGSWR